MTSTVPAPRTTTRTPLEVLSEAYAAFGAGDMATLGALLADDVDWRIADVTPLNGTYRGRDEVFRFLGGLMEQTGGTFSLEVVSAMGNETHACAVVQEHATRGDRTLDASSTHLFTVTDGRVTAFSATSTDDASAAFWAD